MIRRFTLFFLLAGILAPCALPQTMPQTARQAVIEMFFSKTPGTFEKHLPEVTKAAMHKAQGTSGPSMLGAFTLMSSQMQSRGQGFETFDAGPILFALDSPQEHSRLEVRVERDDLRGEEDKIELAFRAYKDGQIQANGLDPRFTLTMKQDAGIWRLNEFNFAIRVSLTDPGLLKTMSTPIQPQVTASTTIETQHGYANYSASHSANEASAAGAMHALLTAEATYATTYPNQGFTCNMPDLGGMGSGSAVDEHHAMLIDPRLANGRKNGYVFRISGCDGPPAAHFKIAAAPADPSMGTRVYCSDESSVVRFSDDGNAASCGSSSKPLP